MWRRRSLLSASADQARSHSGIRLTRVLGHLAHTGLILTVGSCSGREPEADVDRSFVTGKPCAPPCWQDLVPGHSRKGQAYVALRQTSFVIQASITEVAFPMVDDEGARAIEFACTDRPYCGRMLFNSEGILTEIRLPVGYELPFETVISVLSEPDYLESGPHHPEMGGCTLRLVWERPGIVVVSSNPNERDQCQLAEHGEPLSPRALATDLIYVVGGDFSLEPPPAFIRVPWSGLSDE